MGFRGFRNISRLFFICVVSLSAEARLPILPPELDLVFDIDETLVRLQSSYPTPELRAALGKRLVEISYNEFSSAFGAMVAHTERYILAEGLLEFFARLEASPIPVRVNFFSAREKRRNEALLRAIYPSPARSLWSWAGEGSRLRSGEDMTVESEGKKDMRIFEALDISKAVLIDDCWGFSFDQQSFLWAQPSFDSGLERSAQKPSSSLQKFFFQHLFTSLERCFSGLGTCRGGTDFVDVFKETQKQSCESQSSS